MTRDAPRRMGSPMPCCLGTVTRPLQRARAVLCRALLLRAARSCVRVEVQRVRPISPSLSRRPRGGARSRCPARAHGAWRRRRRHRPTRPGPAPRSRPDFVCNGSELHSYLLSRRPPCPPRTCDCTFSPRALKWWISLAGALPLALPPRARSRTCLCTSNTLRAPHTRQSPRPSHARSAPHHTRQSKYSSRSQS